jgi:hypothetical protein
MQILFYHTAIKFAPQYYSQTPVSGITKKLKTV